MLRDYQQRTIDQLYEWFGAGNEGNPCLVLPTGSGKSHIIAALCKDALQTWPETRILMLTHVKELIAQNAEKMRQHWPNCPLGIYSAGLKRKELGEPITFAGIQSVRTKASQIGHVDLVIIDEAHLVSHKDEGGYRTLLTDLRSINPNLRIIGLTASPYRLGHGYITDKPAIFDALIEPVSIEELIFKGYLSTLRSKLTATKLEVDGVHKRGGEYIEAELQAKVDTSDKNSKVAAEIVRLGHNRKSWLIFCAGVAHAQHIATALQAQGITTECVTGETPSNERDRILTDFKAGRITALTNANVLTTGFDAPGIDLIAMLRPTMSPGLYVQMAGRGLRIAPDKIDCIAEGQRVLTDIGLVPIEKVTSSMKVWDGCEFVYHCGVEFRGIQEVISYAGLIATEDHNVWTSNGWKTFGECSKKQIAISVTGNGWKEVRETEGYFRNSKQTRKVKQGIHGGRLHNLFEGIKKGIHNISEGACWLQALRNNNKGNRSAEVVAESSNISKAKVHEQGGFRVSALRRAWNCFRVRLNVSDGIVGAAELGFASSFTDRPNRQQWALCKLEHSFINSVAKFISHKEKQYQCSPSLDQNEPQRNKILGRYSEKIIKKWNDRNGNTRETKKIPTKAEKRKVFDIRNAGPLHRFTVEGLLVSNCLVLDFAGVVEQHGPITAVRPPPKKGDKVGEAPVKVCDHCQEICALSVRVCPACGEAFPEPEKPPLKLHNLDIMGQSGIDLEISGWIWRKQISRASGKEMITCTMYGSLSDAPVTSYYAICHDGFAGERARKNLADIAHKAGVVLDYASADLHDIAKQMTDGKPPTTIEYRKDGRFYTVLSHKW